MFDTINIYTERNWGEPKNFPQNLTNVTEGISDKGSFISGNLENLKVFAGERGTTIKGSINKYFLKDNFQRMTRSDTQQAIEKIEDNLQILVRSGKVSRLDIANHFIMKQQPKNYLRLLEHAKYYTRLQQPYSLYFQNQKRTLNFYDKIKEGKARGENIPEIWQGKNILRYEMRFTKRVQEQLKQEVTAQDLYKEDFYIDIINRWITEFQNIRKMKGLKPIEENLTPQQYKDYLLAKYISINGLDNVLQELEADKGFLTNPKAFQRIKTEIKNAEYLTEESPLMQELEEKILSVQKYYR